MLELFSFEAAVPLHMFEYGLRPERTEQHWHSFYEIGYCLEGSGTFFVGDGTVEVEPGTLLFFPPYEPHIATAGSVGCRCLFVYFGETLLPPEDRWLLRPFARATVWRASEWRSRPEAPDPGPLLSAMLAEYEARGAAYGPLLRGSLLTLAARLHWLEQGRTGDRQWRERSDALDRLKPALDAVAARYREPFGLREAAEALSLSESRTRHLFVEGTGKRFKEYLTYVRIQEAKRLLATGDLPVTDVYLSCGFQSPAPFYRAFRQLVGLNPQQYRDRQRR